MGVKVFATGCLGSGNVALRQTSLEKEEGCKRLGGLLAGPQPHTRKAAWREIGRLARELVEWAPTELTALTFVKIVIYAGGSRRRG
jgi:hypothetical protein